MISEAGDQKKALFEGLRDHTDSKLKVAGRTWVVERSFAWLGRRRRVSKDDEWKGRASETFITTVVCTQMVRRIAPRMMSHIASWAMCPPWF